MLKNDLRPPSWPKMPKRVFWKFLGWPVDFQFVTSSYQFEPVLKKLFDSDHWKWSFGLVRLFFENLRQMFKFSYKFCSFFAYFQKVVILLNDHFQWSESNNFFRTGSNWYKKVTNWKSWKLINPNKAGGVVKSF